MMRYVIQDHLFFFEFLYFRFRVERFKGRFGNVTLKWRLLDQNTKMLANSSEFTPNQGKIRFVEQQHFSEVRLSTLQDGIPERGESFTIELYDIEGNYQINCGFEVYNILSKVLERKKLTKQNFIKRQKLYILFC